MRDEGVGTLRAASEVSYSQNSRQSRKRLRAIYNFVRFVRFTCDYNPMCSPDAARRRPYFHRSPLKTQKLVLLFFCQKSKSAVICRIRVIGVPSSTFVKKQENGISAFPGKRENNIHICIPIRYKTQKSQLKTNEKNT